MSRMLLAVTFTALAGCAPQLALPQQLDGLTRLKKVPATESDAAQAGLRQWMSRMPQGVTCQEEGIYQVAAQDAAALLQGWPEQSGGLSFSVQQWSAGNAAKVYMVWPQDPEPEEEGGPVRALGDQPLMPDQSPIAPCALAEAARS